MKYITQKQRSEKLKPINLKESRGRLNAETFVSVINEKFGMKYNRTNVSRLLHALNFSWIIPMT